MTAPLPTFLSMTRLLRDTHVHGAYTETGGRIKAGCASLCINVGAPQAAV